MASNSFGQLFKITTWGESHGKALGVVIDGCPPGLFITEKEINKELAKRQGGRSAYTTPRKEPDICEILSGIFEDKTTGAPISIIIKNQQYDSSKYLPIKDLYRPGHANYTYLEKYKIFDYRGGGRSSARETVCRVAAGAVAKKMLRHYGIDLCGYIKEIGGIKAPSLSHITLKSLKKKTLESLIYCPDKNTTLKICEKIEKTQKNQNSLGGVIELIVKPMPVGLGDPVYEKLEANLAKAMMSIPASKGVEFGKGFEASKMYGSDHNDLFIKKRNGQIAFKTNHAGGLLGGISNGMPLILRVAFKPTSSIQKTQKTLSTQGEKSSFTLPQGSRHDPCVAIRAVPIVEAMAALCLVDAILLNQTNSIMF